jgi:CBS domain containing-hemolysin-like protein
MVRHAATPRTVVFALPESCTIAEFMENHADKPFSRIPIYRDNLDDLDGFVLRIELLQALAQGHGEDQLSKYRRPIHAVPRTQTLSTLFNDMIAQRIHIAATLDEFGAFSGIITLEDVIETLLGTEIVDEVDHHDDMQQMARELWKKRAEKMGLPRDETDNQ